MRKIILTALVLIISATGNAQDRNICGNDLILQEINNNPEYKARHDKYFENYAAENKQLLEEANRSSAKGTQEYWPLTIPLVFHILLNDNQITQAGGQQGIIDRIVSQIAVINEDFSAGNIDLANVPAAFQSLIGKANLRFDLARRDATGKAKLGIVFINKPSTFTGYETSQNNLIKENANGGSTAWDYTKYINIWVTNITSTSSSGQILGYAFNADYAQKTMGTSPAYSGVVLHYLALGRRTGFGQRFFSAATEKGRTLTHELGHYFNIWHIWGKNAQASDASCTDDDEIEDTPLQADANLNCPSSTGSVKVPNCIQKSHPGGEMYMNFMDYSTDMCVNMFTVGQVARMRAETMSGGKVFSVTQNPQLTLWPTDIAPVEYNNQVVISPNPTSGIFAVRLLEKYDQLQSIQVMNTMGQLVRNIQVYDQATLTYNINISDLAKGIYMVQLNFDQGTISRKIVVQ